MLAHLSRGIRFRASHRYHRPDWTAEQNRRAFGACADEHSHDYRCVVTVKGPVSEGNELAMDLGLLDRILETEVRARFDGKVIHRDLPEFQIGRALPSTEGLAVYIWRQVGPRLPAGVQLHVVRVEENPDLYSEYSGED